MRERGHAGTLQRATPWLLSLLSAVMLTLAFPNFDFSFLAWLALVPLLIALAKPLGTIQAFFVGWLAGTTFFYASCYWLTYSMIHYGGIPSWLAYPLLLPGPLIVGIFPAIFAMSQMWLVRRWGSVAFLTAPFLWVTLEWARLGVTGQLWNAIGYSQAFHPALIQAAGGGGVYAVSFIIVAVNSTLAYAIVGRSRTALLAGASVVVLIVVPIIGWSIVKFTLISNPRSASPNTVSPTMVLAVQPNVPMNLEKNEDELTRLLDRHITLSETALAQSKEPNEYRLVIWPESPMNFTFGSDEQLRQRLQEFTQRNRTMLLFNSQEPAQNESFYNSALLIDMQGRLVSRYDKIRLMPFGEYVPLPAWLPGANRMTALVGGFTAGDKYSLMNAGSMQMGTFICIESAYPSIARNLTTGGADVLINISNDGYLGPTAVMRQHLANTIFRAVENGRPLLRVTNTGITANIASSGQLLDTTNSFEATVRIWKLYISRNSARTFYTRHGDLFVGICSVISALAILAAVMRWRRTGDARRARA